MNVSVKHLAKTEHITVREALRDAMAEEMRLNTNVFLMGEEVAEYNVSLYILLLLLLKLFPY